MRVLTALAAIAGLVLGVVAIGIAGRPIAEQARMVEAPDAFQLDARTKEAKRQTFDARPATLRANTDARQRPVGQSAEDELERIEPRAPLSELAVAQPPKPKKATKPEDWRPTRLFNPVAAAAGIVEAQGYRVALAGIEPLPVEEDCTFEGRSWPCGARGRTAFRSWLRARALQCVVPPEPDRELITAECNIGKEDPAAWLVANGWARAAEGGPYAEAAEKARSAKKGMFGPPPRPVSVTAPARPAPLNAPAVEPATGAVLEPSAPESTANEVFPPAPPAPTPQ